MTGNRKCEPGCKCGKHSRKFEKCKPDCSCVRHKPETKLKISEGVKRAYQDPNNSLNSPESKERKREYFLRAWRDPNSAFNSPERSRRLSDAQKLNWENPDSVYNSIEHRVILSESQRGRYRGQLTAGHYDADGYYYLVNLPEHPLSHQHSVAEHRFVLWEKLGCESVDCEHECHWGCGRVLTWGGREGIQADHLNGIKDDNNPENLVPSCLRCNMRRFQVGNPVDWSADYVS